MATLYEIDNQILSCIDAESGEIINEDKLSELSLERNKKIENVALWIKNLNADAAMYKAEKESFAEKEKAALQQAEGLKIWLSEALHGEKFKSPRADISFRKSEIVECDESVLPPEYAAIKTEIKPNKNAIKSAIKSGIEIPGCMVISRTNIQIK